jgi:hypothetical protein
VGRQQLVAAFDAGELDELDHHVVPGIIDTGGRALDEAERDGRALVRLPEPAALVGHRDDPPTA